MDKDKMANDLISRQAVIDAINEHLELVTSGLGSDSIAKKYIKRLTITLLT